MKNSTHLRAQKTSAVTPHHVSAHATHDIVFLAVQCRLTSHSHFKTQSRLYKWFSIVVTMMLNRLTVTKREKNETSHAACSSSTTSSKMNEFQKTQLENVVGHFIAH
jgi:hypothetical protein